MNELPLRYSLGLDVSKAKFDACITVQDSLLHVKIKYSRKFPQTAKGFAALTDWLKAKLKGASLFQIALEATGVYHENLLYYLHEAGYPVCLVQGKVAKRYRQSLGIETKNDKLDGYALARMALERSLRPWKPVAENIIQIRAVVRYRKELVDTRVAFQNRLHAINHAHHQDARIIASMKSLIAELEGEIRDVEKQAKELARQDEAFWNQLSQIIESLPGIGFTSLIMIIAETNGFANFSNLRQVVSYAGLDVIENQSGKSTGKTRISKNGNVNLRWSLYMPATTIIRHKVKPFYSLYERVRKRNPKIKKKAQVAVQRKLLIIIYTLWKNERTFDPEWHTKNAEEALHNNDPKNGGSSDQRPELHRIEKAMPVPS